MSGPRRGRRGPNPFEKYLTPEDRLQHSVIYWTGLVFPTLRFHHSPNEGKRSPFERYKFKYLGSDEGFPDLIFPELRLVIELKVRPNKPTEAQTDWLLLFAGLGWETAVVYDSWEDACVIIQTAALKADFVPRARLLDLKWNK